MTAIRNRAVYCWRGISLPYPEVGIRLIRQDRIENFDSQMREMAEELIEAVGQLDERYGELKEAARDRLGRLFNPADYPSSLQGLFRLEWDFPSIQPPDYLRQLNPELYEQERQRIAARFDEAVKLAEEAFTTEFARLVGHLTERLSGSEEGQKKVFRDSAVSNLLEFFQRFKSLNVQSNPQLDQLVETARQAIQGVQPQDLRDQEALRRQISSQLSGVQSVLDGLLVDQPRRRILRAPRTEVA